MRRMLRVELVHSDCFVIILAGRRHYVFNLSVCPSIHSSVTKLVRTVF